jgi:outer membrane protein insertion porin family
MSRIGYIICFIFLLMISSCNVTKNVPDNDALYIGSKLNLMNAVDSMYLNQNDLKAELNSLIKIKPNSNFLGLPYKLMIYNMAGTPSGKGLSYWLKNSVGEPPVLGSSINFEKNRDILENRLENRGYFQSEVEVDTIKKNKKLQIVYAVTVHPAYTIRKMQYKVDSVSVIGKEINALAPATLLKQGKNYDLDIIKAERNRIDAGLKERGMYFFNADYLIMDVDSAIGTHQVDIVCRFKKETPQKAKQDYRIGDVFVFADYKKDTDTSIHNVLVTGTFYKGYHIYDPLNKVKPGVFRRSIILKPGDIYSREVHNQSLKHLVSLGMYKFVSAQFQETDTSKYPSLNAFYYLTASPVNSLRAEVSGLTKSNNSAGTEISLTWKHRNFFRGAEQFSTKIYGGFEKQVSTQQPTVTTNRFGVEFNLLSPRIIAPFKWKAKAQGGFTPQTKTTLAYEFFERNTQYTLNSGKLSFGYIWKSDIRQEHRFDIFSMNLVRPTYISPEYQLALDTNITLARSIEKQFIVGPNYNYNFNTQIKPNIHSNNYFFNANIDVSGNIMGLVSGADISNGKQKELFGIPYSQYIRTELDFRHYLRINAKTILASRILGGLGYAYGNSDVLPFMKAFFAGGTNDIRAFRARSLGPGTYYAGNASTSTVVLSEQPGDIKLEFNSELRMKLFSVLYGAFFVDAGNIWTMKSDSSRPGSKFTGNFMKEMAVGTGLGLRVDVSFFVLRLDFSFPVRKPFLADGNRWVIKDINFGDSEWRKQNLVFNLAIGYPF